MAQDQAVQSDRKQQMTKIDTDFHLQFPHEILIDYISDSFIKETVEQYGPPGKFSSDVSQPYVSGNETVYETHGQAVTRDEVLEVKAEYGIDKTIVQPGTHVTFSRKTRYPVINEELLSAYNRYMLDRVVDVEAGIYGAVTIPDWNPDLAVEELERHGTKDGIVAAHSWQGSDVLWGDYSLDPVHETLERLELPLLLHVGGGTPSNPHPAFGMRHWVQDLIVNNAEWALSHSLNMIFNGVFDEYPDLRVVINESGIHWIPNAAWAGNEYHNLYPEDQKYSERMYEKSQKYIKKMPSEYIFENFYTTTQPIALPQRSKDIKAMLEFYRAEDMFLFSTDWPHMSVDTVDWVFNTPNIDDALAQKILSENAEEVFQFPE